nr:reverse transcriptase domain-containing protein [Tanacetum cinerariifolium]
RRNHRLSKQIVEPELRTIIETPVDTMADTRTMSKLLQAPTEGYEDAIVIPAILPENFEVKEKQENDKIESKPDKNGKRGEAWKSQSQSQSRKKDKKENTSSRDQKIQILEVVLVKE